jgi:hypothetical protein
MVAGLVFRWTKPVSMSANVDITVAMESSGISIPLVTDDGMQLAQKEASRWDGEVMGFVVLVIGGLVQVANASFS